MNLPISGNGATRSLRLLCEKGEKRILIWVVAYSHFLSHFSRLSRFSRLKIPKKGPCKPDSQLHGPHGLLKVNWSIISRF
jgi:hypothetical protein